MQNFRENWNIYWYKLLQNINILRVFILKKFNIEEFTGNKFSRMAKDEQFATEVSLN